MTSDRTREARDVLHIVRDFPDKGDALNRQQLANLLETDGVFSFCHFRGNRNALDHCRFIGDLLFNAQLFEQPLADVPAAGAVRVGDGAGLQQRFTQFRVAADIRYFRSFFYHHANGRIREFRSRPRPGLAGLFELLQRIAHHNHHVGLLAAREPVWDRLRRIAH